jgi:hypothetical protein
MSKIFAWFLLIMMALAFYAPHLSFAAVDKDDLGIGYGADTDLTTRDVREIVASIINVSLGMLGTIALVVIIYAGFLWMTAGGESGKIDEAKNMMKAGVIGLAIILAAYSIATFVITQLTTAAQ